jgi:OOP family OmpA-OmpF porin
MAAKTVLEILPMKPPLILLAAALLLTGAARLHAAPGDQPVKPLPAAADAKTQVQVQSRSLPARGLFQGDRLTDSARQQLAELIVDAAGLRVDVALLVPTGPWKIDDSGSDENALTPARLQAVKRFLADRGVDPRHIYVESRIDEKLKEPRLEVQLAGRPAAE